MTGWEVIEDIWLEELSNGSLPIRARNICTYLFRRAGMLFAAKVIE